MAKAKQMVKFIQDGEPMFVRQDLIRWARMALCDEVGDGDEAFVICIEESADGGELISYFRGCEAKSAIATLAKIARG